MIKSRKRVIISDGNLVLQGVQRDFSGDYTCSAQNSEGVGESQPVRLDVKCKKDILSQLTTLC